MLKSDGMFRKNRFGECKMANEEKVIIKKIQDGLFKYSLKKQLANTDKLNEYLEDKSKLINEKKYWVEIIFNKIEITKDKHSVKVKKDAFEKNIVVFTEEYTENKKTEEREGKRIIQDSDELIKEIERIANNAFNDISKEYANTKILIERIFFKNSGEKDDTKRFQDQYFPNDKSYAEYVSHGGSGIILKVKDKDTKMLRILKIPRPDTQTGKDEKKFVVLAGLETETEQLSKLSHSNIIHVHNIYKFKCNDIFKNQDVHIDRRISSIEKCYKNRNNEECNKNEILKNTENEINRLIDDVFDIFYNVTKAIHYLHNKQIIHFDIKPANIFIEKPKEGEPRRKHPRPILADLGLADEIEPNYEGNGEPKDCGYTYFYAHKDLTSQMTSRESENRVMCSISHNYLYNNWKKYDLYALGITLLEILGKIHRTRGNISPNNYVFEYLHLSATRMLDSLNRPQEEIERKNKLAKSKNISNQYFQEKWRTLSIDTYKKIRYENIDQVLKDLKKQKYSDYFSSRIPEISDHYTNIINVGHEEGTNLTPRVRKLIQHPALQRLTKIKQLGLLHSIFPLATHNRFTHTIGIYSNCCLYLKSLIADNYNPFFKQLFDPKDLDIMLVVSLLHDIGHYPFAHNIEKRICDNMEHEKIGIEIIKNVKDPDKKTIEGILQKHDRPDRRTVGQYWNFEPDDILFIKQLFDKNYEIPDTNKSRGFHPLKNIVKKG